MALRVAFVARELQWLPWKFLFRQSRRDIVGMQNPKLHFRCLLFDRFHRLWERLVCRDRIFKFVHVHLLIHESDSRLAFLIVRQSVLLPPVYLHPHYDLTSTTNRPPRHRVRQGGQRPDRCGSKNSIRPLI